MTSNERLQEAVRLLRDVHTHIEELAEAWQRGVISEHDGRGGMRSNRNAELLSAVYAYLHPAPALDAAPAADEPDALVLVKALTAIANGEGFPDEWLVDPETLYRQGFAAFQRTAHAALAAYRQKVQR